VLRRQSLRGEQRLCFLFIGAASRFAELPQRAGDRDLGDLFRFFPYQERSALKLSLGVPDVHLVSLRREVDGLIVPSKPYGIVAANRPIVAVAASDGEIADLLRRHGCGLVVEPGEGEHLAYALERPSRHPRPPRRNGPSRAISTPNLRAATPSLDGAGSSRKSPKRDLGPA
jgi:hypothetical protein